ncbi:hypothetical protein BS47DRAFT_1365309 [Hydnum rufescens UP504]|uniref:Uncharacterized protein n=1 Tax=Hydnum rufescens UP504 TaxID=1448309 RepID=A0A9P6APK1_9AGAM|nr:hypothetical protein BS47DRAFT_1365309 [Hydnum rufescens UP504]
MKVAIASLKISSARFDILTSIEAKTHVLTCLQKDIDIATNHINLHDKVSATRLNKIKKQPFFALQMNIGANAILPPAIILKTLFKLDVDDDTWHDVEVLNCKGELACCHMECAAMQTWFEEEYEATSFAEQYTPDADLKYHLQIRLQSLGALGEMWQQKMPALVSARPWPEMVPATLFVPTHRQRLTPDNICSTPNDDLDIQSSDNDDETELEPATICDTHVMEEIDRQA